MESKVKRIMNELNDYIMKSELSINGWDKWKATGLFGIGVTIYVVDCLLNTTASLFNFLFKLLKIIT